MVDECDENALDEQYRKWLDVLEHEVIEDEFGYEPGEFTVYSGAWEELYKEGLSPREAWQRALDGHRNARKDGGLYAPIVD